MNPSKHDFFYKSQRSFFLLWKRLTMRYKQFNVWFIDAQGISMFIEFYMEKNKSVHDKAEFSPHEQALEPLLRTVANVLGFITTYKNKNSDNPRERTGIKISDRDSRNLINVDFVQKMLGENYHKTRYNALKRILKVCAKNNEFFSSHIIATCLKEINTLMINDDGICFFEVLSDLMLMEDNCTQARLEMVLGVPTPK